ncbi:YicC family protein [Puniceicoccales bacterium CK1056]|uniref:YicC family protein n=1 Tax=Oceanipulchritudo coccoides TaxID=2706888 RepID=A0A6B2M5U0_9BACT|nr:YicC/YloC family endoribonuclease [Oceanipulchritudo coccoides]NDV63507.1 YicC family protein [Oceanipulchritudo coccoides]
MMYSMTGFGRNQTNFAGMDISVEINSVNRRNLEISVSLPREWQLLERDIQALLRGAFARGKLHVSIQAQPAAAESGFHWDEAGLDSSLRRLGEVAKRQGIDWPPGADALVRLAALNKVDVLLPGSDEISVPLMECVKLAAGELKDMRGTEGAALESDLKDRLSALRGGLTTIGEESSSTVPRYREILFQRLGQANLELDLNDERVLREIAIFADKCDISEEQTRLESHFDQFAECLAAGSPIGRKLEFILQEINREFNTIGSKSNNVEISRHVIEAKNEVERIREQIQNIE